MPRLPAKVAPPWCYVCNHPPGPDCPQRGRSPRQVRRRLKNALRRNPDDQ